MIPSFYKSKSGDFTLMEKWWNFKEYKRKKNIDFQAVKKSAFSHNFLKIPLFFHLVHF